MVTVIYHKAASLPRTGRLIVIAMWRQYALRSNSAFLSPHESAPKRHRDRFNCFPARTGVPNTQTQTTLRATCVGKGRIDTLLAAYVNFSVCKCGCSGDVDLCQVTLTNCHCKNRDVKSILSCRFFLKILPP